MNAYANYVVSHLFAQSWQIALLAGMVGLISLVLRNRSAHLRYLLWLVVLAKCLVPPILTIPLAVLPEGSAIPSVALTNVAEEPSAPEMSVSARDIAQPQAWKPTLPGMREAIALGWMAGVFLFLLWVGGRAVRYATWLRARRKPLPPELEKSIQDLSLGFRFRTRPGIWLLDDIGQPFVWGLLRGSVYLPADFIDLNGFVKRSSTGVSSAKNRQGQDGPATHGQDAHATADRQRCVLAHELSHVARFDAAVNLLQVLAQAVYWFHPFAWWANRKMRQEREKCCDEMAVAHLSAPPEQYTGAIVEALAAERWSTHPIPSLAIVGSVKDIEERIRTMLTPGKTFRRRPSLVAATVASLFALVTIPTALVLTARGQTPPPAAGANKSAADTEKPEQPRFAARTFNSQAAFDVVVMETAAAADPRVIGSTPSAAPLSIPACYIWWVQPSSPVRDWDLLAREINENEVPGLKLDLATNADMRGTCPGAKSDSITNADMKRVAGMTHLRWLNLSRTQVGDAGLADLKGLSALQYLRLEDTQVTDAGLEHLEDLPRLEDLILWNKKITDAGLGHLTHLTGLQGLYLVDAQVTDSGLAHLKALTKLRNLCLMNTQVTDAGFVHLEGLTGLRTLYLGKKITDAGLAHLKRLTGLEGLDFSSAKITDAGLVHLEGLVRLQSLNLEYTQVTDAGLAHLRGLMRLQWLCLIGTKIDGTGLAHLKSLTGLEFLNLAGTPTTDAGLAHLQGLTGLRHLYLGTGITDVGLQHLKGLAGLEYLVLSKTQQVTEPAIEELKKSLPKLTVARW